MRVQLAAVRLDERGERALVAAAGRVEQALARGAGGIVDALLILTESLDRREAAISSHAMNFDASAGLTGQTHEPDAVKPVVHLELHTSDLRARPRLLRRAVRLAAGAIDARDGSYLALDLGERIGGGIVECGDRAPAVVALCRGAETSRKATDTARALGAAVLLEPREGPAGWRSGGRHARRAASRVLAAEAIGIV